MTPPVQPPAGEDVRALMAEVMDRQARVTRAESALDQARRRLGESVDRLSRVATAQGIALPPLGAALLQHHGGITGTVPGEHSEGTAPRERPTSTLRARIVSVMEASPDKVFTPARLVPRLGTSNRDSIRNTLLVLAAKGLIEKRGAGQYQARKLSTEPLPDAPATEEGGAP